MYLSISQFVCNKHGLVYDENKTNYKDNHHENERRGRDRKKDFGVTQPGSGEDKSWEATRIGTRSSSSFFFTSQCDPGSEHRVCSQRGLKSNPDSATFSSWSWTSHSTSLRKCACRHLTTSSGRIDGMWFVDFASFHRHEHSHCGQFQTTNPKSGRSQNS